MEEYTVKGKSINTAKIKQRLNLKTLVINKAMLPKNNTPSSASSKLVGDVSEHNVEQTTYGEMTDPLKSRKSKVNTTRNASAAVKNTPSNAAKMRNFNFDHLMESSSKEKSRASRTRRKLTEKGVGQYPEPSERFAGDSRNIATLVLPSEKTTQRDKDPPAKIGQNGN